MDPFSLATGVVGVIAAVLAFGGAGCSIVNSVTAAVQELRAFSQEIHNFGRIWKQAEDQLNLRRSEVGQDLERSFLAWTEETTHLLLEADKELRRFQRYDKDQSNKELRREGPFAALRQMTVWKKREERVQAYMRQGIIKVQRTRLATASSSLTQWILLIQ